MAAFTTVTSTSMFGRARSAIIGFIFGPLLLIGAVILIFWNESHSVRVIRSLKEGAEAVEEASATEFDAENDGELLHLSGDTATNETLRDPVFGIEASGVRLIREVQVYEWTERESGSKTTTSVTGTKTTTKTYEYEKKWDSKLHDSAKFKQTEGHENPSELKYTPAKWNAKKVTLGAYELDSTLATKIKNAEPISLKEDAVTLPEGAKLTGNRIYVGTDPDHPEVGDLRISESLVPTGPTSVIAKQGPGSRLSSFHAKAGEDIALVESGTKSAEDMFLTAKSENRVMTWILRLVGFAMLLFGLLLLLGPLSTFASFIPFLGGLVEAGIFFISLIVSVMIWALLVGAAWLVVRPLLGGTLLVIALTAGFFGIKHLRKHNAAVRAQTAAASAGPAAASP